MVEVFSLGRADLPLFPSFLDFGDQFSSSSGFLSSPEAMMKASKGRSVGDPSAGVRSGGDPPSTHLHERNFGSDIGAELFFLFLVLCFILCMRCLSF